VSYFITKHGQILNSSS